MTIAVHITLPERQVDVASVFTYNCFTRLAASHPENHYIFIFDMPFLPGLITEKNITPVLAGPQVKNRLLQYYFYNFKIPRLLMKYSADYFVSADVCSLQTKVPQCMIVSDLSFLRQNNSFTKTDVRYLKKYTIHFLKKSSSIVVLNPSLKKTLFEKYGVDSRKISYISNGIDESIKPFSYEQAENIRNKFTEGKDYFLFFATASSAANVIATLKAFSIFKKWQKSNMQLVILFSSTEKNIIKEISSYKYKAEVKILHGISAEIYREAVASAYACIQLPSIEATETDGLNALASATPLIARDNDFCRSIYADGALYSSAEENEISKKMMLLYKDENARAELIKKGMEVSAAHTWQNAALLLQQTMQPLTAL